MIDSLTPRYSLYWYSLLYRRW